MVNTPATQRKQNTPVNGRATVDPTVHEPQDNNNALDNMLVPLDGGWGWIVVFGSFMIHIVTDGMTYSFGLFYNEFLSYFNEGKGYTAWIVSIMVGVTFASGPISSSFVNRYGCREVTIAGSILAAVCIVISVFAQNVFTLIITIGFGTGLGFGLIYLPAIVSVTTYFEAKRSLATGIAVCGSGFGTFVFAPLSEHLIGAYGWRGALLIIGGIVLNCIIFGALFRPLEPPRPKKNKRSTIIDNNTTVAELAPLKIKNRQHNEPYLQLPHNAEGITSNTLCRSNSLGHTMTHVTNYNNNSDANALGNGKSGISLVSRSTSNHDIMPTSMSHSQLSNMAPATQMKDMHREKSGSGTMYRPDILYQGSLHNIPDYKRSRTDVSGSGALHRYGSLKQSMQLSHSQVSDYSLFRLHSKPPFTH